MKKLSAVQLKQQALVFSVADSLEAQALEELNGMQQCWFDVQYHQFPGSLLLRFQFENGRSGVKRGARAKEVAAKIKRSAT